MRDAQNWRRPRWGKGGGATWKFGKVEADFLEISKEVFAREVSCEMARKFTTTKLDRRAIDSAIARLDAQKVVAAKRRAKAAAVKRRAREKERKQVAAKPTVKHMPNALKMRWAVSGWKVLCARMDPALWYGAGQIFDLMADAPRGSVKAWLWNRAIPLGYIERAGNPDFDPATLATCVVQERYLYRIAQNQTQAVQEWREALGAVNPTGQE